MYLEAKIDKKQMFGRAVEKYLSTGVVDKMLIRWLCLLFFSYFCIMRVYLVGYMEEVIDGNLKAFLEKPVGVVCFPTQLLCKAL